VQYGNMGTIRRIGAILERIDATNYDRGAHAGQCRATHHGVPPGVG
jgi:hypothetical protein